MLSLNSLVHDRHRTTIVDFDGEEQEVTKKGKKNNYTFVRLVVYIEKEIKK